MNSEHSKDDNEHDQNEHDDNEQVSEELSIINFGKKANSEQTKHDNEQDHMSEQPEFDDYYQDIDHVHEVVFAREDPT